MTRRACFPAPLGVMNALGRIEALLVGSGGGLEVESPGSEAPSDAVAEVVCYECEESHYRTPAWARDAERFAREHRRCDCRNPWTDDESTYTTDGEGE